MDRGKKTDKELDRQVDRQIEGSWRDRGTKGWVGQWAIDKWTKIDGRMDEG